MNYWEREREREKKKKKVKKGMFKRSGIDQTLHSGDGRADAMDSFPSLRSRAGIRVVERPPGQRCRLAHIPEKARQTFHCNGRRSTSTTTNGMRNEEEEEKK